MSDNPAARPEKDRPWVMRTYAGHSSATESNKLYRMNLAKGQTGLSVAFDLPTQTGYDPDSPLSRGEVGKVGVPIPQGERVHKPYPTHRHRPTLSDMITAPNRSPRSHLAGSAA